MCGIVGNTPGARSCESNSPAGVGRIAEPLIRFCSHQFNLVGIIR